MSYKALKVFYILGFVYMFFVRYFIEAIYLKLYGLDKSIEELRDVSSYGKEVEMNKALSWYFIAAFLVFFVNCFLTVEFYEEGEKVWYITGGIFCLFILLFILKEIMKVPVFLG